MRQSRVERSFKKNLLWAAVAATISGGVVSVEAADPKPKAAAEVPADTISDPLVFDGAPAVPQTTKDKTKTNTDVRLKGLDLNDDVIFATLVNGTEGGTTHGMGFKVTDDRVIRFGNKVLELTGTNADINHALEAITRASRVVDPADPEPGGTLNAGGTVDFKDGTVHVKTVGRLQGMNNAEADSFWQDVLVGEKATLRTNTVFTQGAVIKGALSGYELAVDADGREVSNYLRATVFTAQAGQLVDSQHRTAIHKDGGGDEDYVVYDKDGNPHDVKLQDLTPTITYIDIEGDQPAILAIHTRDTDEGEGYYDRFTLKGPSDNSAALVPAIVDRSVDGRWGALKAITVQNRSFVSIVGDNPVDGAYTGVNQLSLSGEGATFGIDLRQMLIDTDAGFLKPAAFRLLQSDTSAQGKAVGVTVGEGHFAYLDLDKEVVDGQVNKYTLTVNAGLVQGTVSNHDGFIANRGSRVGGAITPAAGASKGNVFNDGSRYFGAAVDSNGAPLGGDDSGITGLTDYYGTVTFSELSDPELLQVQKAAVKMVGVLTPNVGSPTNDSDIPDRIAGQFVVNLKGGPHTVHGRLVVEEGDNGELRHVPNPGDDEVVAAPTSTVRLSGPADEAGVLTFKKGSTLSVMLDRSNNVEGEEGTTAIFTVAAGSKVVVEKGAKFAALAPQVTVEDGKVKADAKYDQVAGLMRTDSRTPVQRTLYSEGATVEGEGFTNTGSVFFDTVFAAGSDAHLFKVSAASNVEHNIKAQGVSDMSAKVLAAQAQTVQSAFKAVPVPADEEDADEPTVSVSDARLYNALQAAELQGKLTQLASESTFQSVVNGANVRQVVESMRAAHSRAILPRLERYSAGLAWGSEGMVAAGDGDEERGVWGQYIFSDGEQGDKDGVAGYSLKMNGITVGVDAMANETLTVGAAFTYAKTDIDTKDISQSTKGDNYAVSLYGGWMQDNWFANGVLSYAWSDNDYKSQSALLGADHKGDGKAKGWGLTLGGGYNMALDAQWLLQPKVEFNYYDVKVDDFDLKGAVAPAKWKTDNVQVVELGAGIRVLGDFDLEEGKLTPEFRLMGYYDFKDNNYGGEYALVGGASGAITGMKREQGRGVAGLGLGFAMDNGLAMGLDYDYNFSGDYKAHSIKANLSYAF